MTAPSHALPFAIAHRGGSEAYPENTLGAFTDALELGFERLETDVHLGGDDELLAVHGMTLEREDGGDYVFVGDEAIAIAGLKKVDREAMQDDGLYVPTLAEVLELSKDTFWNIDAKTPTSVDPLLAELRARNLFERVCLGSFDEESIQKLRAQSPPGTQSALVESELIELYMASLTPEGEAALPEHTRAQVPTTFAGIEVTTQAFIDTAHRLNVPVDVWTINDPAEMKRLIDLKIDGIFTDRLRVLKDVLTVRKMWPEQQS